MFMQSKVMGGKRCRVQPFHAIAALLLAGLPGGLVACGVAGADAPGDEAGDPATVEPAAVERIAGTPAPVASVTLTAGHVVEFYDFGTTALIVETAPAYTPPAYNHTGPTSPDQLASIWTRVAPGRPVPAALSALQHRLTSLPATPAAPPVTVAVVPESHQGGAKLPGLIGAAPVGCNNGCCDFNWLSTLGQCQGGYDFSWFLYNYGWTYANSTNDIIYDGLVCSAQGTSVYSVSVGGSGGTWSVPQATYRWFSWTAGWSIFGFNAQNMSSSVNSSTNSHLHTYCGGVIYN